MKPFAIAFLLFSLLGCKNKEIDPRQRIVGKWETIYIGNGENMHPIENPPAYRNFLEDSILIEYEYATKKTTTRKYWVDSLLHIGTQRQDGFWITFDYKYWFYDDKMRWEVVNANAIFYDSIHKRIN